MRSSAPTTVMIMALTVAGAVVTTTAIKDCTAAEGDNGSRAGYHSPDSTDKYLPDCGNVLSRDYYRVFEKADGTAYMMPRPDGLGLTHNLCTTDHEASAKAQQYGLCDESVSDPGIINSMVPADALMFATIFHRNLVFASAGGTVSPFAPDADLQLACNISQPSDAADSYCDFVRNRASSGTDIGFMPSPEAAAVIASALNQIYDVLGVGEVCDQDVWGTAFDEEGNQLFGSFLCPTAGCTSAPRGCSYDMSHEVITASRDCCPKLCYAVNERGGECGGKNSGSNTAASSLHIVATVGVAFFIMSY